VIGLGGRVTENFEREEIRKRLEMKLTRRMCRKVRNSSVGTLRDDPQSKRRSSGSKSDHVEVT
jgi:hypothetical protein